MTDTSLEMFSEILDASESVRGMAKDGKFGFVGKLQWAVFQKPKITFLREALEAYKSNLTLMLGALDVVEKTTRPMYIHCAPALPDNMLIMLQAGSKYPTKYCRKFEGAIKAASPGSQASGIADRVRAN